MSGLPPDQGRTGPLIAPATAPRIPIPTLPEVEVVMADVCLYGMQLVTITGQVDGAADAWMSMVSQMLPFINFAQAHVPGTLAHNLCSTKGRLFPDVVRSTAVISPDRHGPYTALSVFLVLTGAWLYVCWRNRSCSSLGAHLQPRVARAFLAYWYKSV